MEEFEELNTEWLERETIRRALDGDREAAVELLQIAVAGLYAGRLSPAVSFYLARALQGVLPDPTGAKFEVGFRLKRSRGQKSTSAANRDALLAVWVHLAIGRGMKPADAEASARECFGVENVARSRRDFTVTACDDDGAPWDQVFIAKGKPLPPRQ